MKPETSKILRFISSALITALILGGFYTAYKSKRKIKKYKVTRFYMDTYVEIMVAAPSGDSDKIAQCIDEAFEVFKKMDSRYDFHDKTSYLQQVNQKVSSPIEDEEFLKIIKMSLRFANKTEGAFDPTLGAVTRLYPIGEENPVPPDLEKVKNALETSGYEKVSIEKNLVKKPAGLLFDLGGVLKGYAVDKAAEKLKSMGVKNFIVNGGGNIWAAGRSVSGGPWRIGVENPRSSGDVITVLELDNQAVATSGDYQRYFFYEGKRYHHVIDPRTGLPASEAFSATVIAPTATEADVMSTAAFVLGRKKGMEMLEKNNLQGIIIDRDGYSVTPELSKKIDVDYNVR